MLVKYLLKSQYWFRWIITWTNEILVHCLRVTFLGDNDLNMDFTDMYPDLKQKGNMHIPFLSLVLLIIKYVDISLASCKNWGTSGPAGGEYIPEGPWTGDIWLQIVPSDGNISLMTNGVAMAQDHHLDAVTVGVSISNLFKCIGAQNLGRNSLTRCLCFTCLDIAHDVRTFCVSTLIKDLANVWD